MSYVTYLAILCPAMIIPVNNQQTPVKFTVNALSTSCQYLTIKSTGIFNSDIKGLKVKELFLFLTVDGSQP